MSRTNKREIAAHRKKQIQTLLGKQPVSQVKRKDQSKKVKEREEESDDEKSYDKYNIEQIYDRNQLTIQERRFGSPDFSYRTKELMNNLPTNDLEKVKNGVELISSSKQIKGALYNESPYFEIEVEESESDFDSEAEELRIKYKKELKSAGIITNNQSSMVSPPIDEASKESSKVAVDKDSDSLSKDFDSITSSTNKLEMSGVESKSDQNDITNKIQEKNRLDLKISVSRIPNEISSIEVAPISKSRTNRELASNQNSK